VNSLSLCRKKNSVRLVTGAANEKEGIFHLMGE
jgi:hypothetical protein